MNFIQKCGLKCWHWLVGATIVAAWILMVIFGYMAFYPFNPITFNDTEFPVLTKEVKRGENLTFVVDSCKHMMLPAEVQVSYVDGIVFDTPTILTAKGEGCEVANVSQVVPDGLPLGEYHLRIIFKYRVSHFQEKSIVKFTETFEVIE